MTMGQSARLLQPKPSLHPSLDPQICGTESRFFQDGILKTINMKNSQQGTWGFTREKLLHFITNGYTPDLLALALFTTLQ